MVINNSVFVAPMAGSRLRGNDNSNGASLNTIFVAPMAGITDKPFRRILRKYSSNAALVTEMISCHSIVAEHKNCPRNFDRYEDEGDIGAQIFGAEPKLMAEAAKILAGQGAKWIDINMGCPVPKVATKAGAGAFLMCDHELAGRIIKSVVAAVDIPVSVKTRLGWDEKTKNWQDLARIARNSGVAFVALHGRTRAQGYTGAAKLELIPDLGIPIIANGDIATYADILKYENLGYDGSMVGRALLGRPWLLGELTGENSGTEKNIGSVVLEHLEMTMDYYGSKMAIPLFRKNVAWYSNGMQNSAEFRTKVNQITDKVELKSAINEFWGCFH